MQIPISKDGGIEPHLTTCTVCGGPGDALTVGVLLKAEIPGTGQYVYANRGQQTKVAKDLVKQGIIRNGIYDLHWEHVEDGEVVPLEPCKKCLDKVQEAAKVVREGGVCCRCLECGMQGVIRPSPFATEVREIHKIEAPAPCGVEFTKCEEHGAFNE